MRQIMSVNRHRCALGAVVLAAALCVGSGASAQSTTGGPSAEGGGFVVKSFTRTIGGRQVRESYLLRNRSGDSKSRKRRSKKSVPYCRRGLFGRVENAPCKGRRRSGGVQDGQRY